MKNHYTLLNAQRPSGGDRRGRGVNFLRHFTNHRPACGRLLWTLFLAFFCGWGTFSAVAQDFRWGAQIGAEGEDANYGMAVDAAGNVYLTGQFESTVDFDPGPGTVNLTTSGGSDVYVMKLRPDRSLVWVKRIGSTGDDFGFQLDVTPSGAVYVTGNFNGTVDFDPGSGTTVLDAASGRGFVLKLTTDGDLTWVRQFDCVNQALAVEPSGNVYLTGTFAGTVDFDPGPGSLTYTAGAAADLYIAKLSDAGQLLWAKHLRSISASVVNYSTSIDVDGAGNAYFTGKFGGSVDFDAGSTDFVVSVTGPGSPGGGPTSNIFICKYSEDGLFRWVGRIERPPFTGIINYSLTTDGPGNVYLAGTFNNSNDYEPVDFDPGPGTFMLNRDPNAWNELFIEKLDTDGRFQWVKQFASLAYTTQGNRFSNEMHSIALDPAGNIYTVGTFGTYVDFDPGPATLQLRNSASGFDVFVSKLDGNGNFISVKRLDGNSPAGIRFKISPDAGGNVFLAGGYSSYFATFWVGVDLDPGPDTYNITLNDKASDIILVRLDNLLTTAAVSNSVACAGSTIGLSLSVTGGDGPYSYTWSAPAGISLPANTNTSALTGTVSAGTTGLQTLTVTAAGQGGFPVSTTTVSVSVLAAPSLTITAAPSLTIVTGNSVTLTASGGTSHTWTGGSTGNSLTVLPASTMIYSVTGSNASGCSGQQSVTVVVNPIPCSAVLYVTESGSGLQNGSSWVNALPGTLLQQAINAAAGCGGSRQVWVAAGTYTPTSTTARDISFSMQNNVAIYGGFAGSETALSGRNLATNPTILSGEIGNAGLSDNSYHVIFNNQLNNTARLDGFVITAGNANDTGNNDAGGGIRNNDGNPVIVNCIFRNNQATYGGALYSQNAEGPVLTNCAFLNNTGLTGGGAISLYANSPVLTNCSFQGNTSPDGGIIQAPGGGTPVLTNCVLFNNGSSIFTGSTPTLSYCLLPADVSNYVSGPGNLTTSVSPFQSTTSLLLNVCTPAINAGTGSASGLSGITTDLNSNARVFGSAVDMGAYELQRPSATIPVTAAPSWTISPGTTVTLTASGATSYTWTGGLTGAVFTASPTSSTTYSVRWPDASGCIGLMAVTVVLTTPPCGPVIYVTESGTGLQDGSSWANALPGRLLQYAIDHAAGCGGARQVWVRRGTYTPTTTTDRYISFTMRNNVAVYGSFLGSETALSGRPAVDPITEQPGSSTLSGEIGDPASLADNSRHIIDNPASLSLNSSAVLDGFVITRGSSDTYGAGMNNNGSSPTVTNCLFLENSGGGMYNSGSSPILTNCMFQSNTAIFGAGVYNKNGSNVLMENCRFITNHAQGIGSGGGIYDEYSSSTVINSTLERNIAPYGGAFAAYESTSRLINCRLLDNFVDHAGGAIESISSNLTVLSSQLHGNSAHFGGGGIVSDYSNITLINCSLVNNVSDNFGGAIRNYFSGLELTNCSFQGNRSNSGGAVENVESTPVLTNCVLFDNGADNTFANFSELIVIVNHSLLEPSVINYTGVSNLTTTVSPFISATGTELSPCSPAINAGNNSATGLTGITTDLAGNPRRYQNGIVDMGAYEFQGDGTPLVSFSVLGSGTATCAASPTITLSGSETGVSYQLQRDGLNTGTTVAGTGSALSFGPQSLSGTYTIIATQTSNSCTLVMASSVTVVSSTATISVTAPAVTTGTTGVAFTQSFSVSNGVSPYTFTRLQGTLPPGLILATDGEINGVPTQSGTFAVTVLTTDVNSCSALSSYSLTINCPGLTVNTPTVATATVGVDAFDTFIWSITGADTYSFTFGGLPPGLSVTTEAENYRAISGRPTQAGVFPVSLTVTNAYGCSLVAPPFNITINCPGLTVNTPTLFTATAGVNIPNNLIWFITGSSPYSFTFGGLPPGLSVATESDNYRAIGGTPTQVGVFPVSLTVTNAYGCSFVAPPFTITVNCPSLTVNTPTVATAAVGVDLYNTFAWSITGDDTYSFTFSGLPPGLSVTTASENYRAISGRPTQAGVFPVSLTVTNAYGCSLVAPPFNITINCPGLTVNTPTEATATVGVDAFDTFIWSITGADTYSFTFGGLPPGLSVTAASENYRAISGTPTQVGVFPVSLTVTNEYGCSFVAPPFNIPINCPTMGISSTANPASCGASGSISFTTTLPSGSYSLSYVGTGSPKPVTVSGGTFMVNLSAGSYSSFSLSQTGTGCVLRENATVSLTNPDSPTPVLTAGNGGTLTCAQTSLTLTASGGNSYTFARSGGGGIISQNAAAGTAVVNMSGTYSVTVANAAGCTSQTSIVINADNDLPSLSISPSSVTLTCASPSAILSVVGTGNARWSTGAQSATISVASAGTYSVTLTGGNGCTSVSSATVVSATAAPALSINPSSTLISCASPAVSLSAVGTGQVLWSTGAVGAVISVSVADTYSVTLTNGGGCTATTSIVVSASSLGTATVTAGGSLGCGVTTTTVRVQASGATSFTLLGPSGFSAVNSSGVFSVTAGGSYTGLAGQASCVVSNTAVVVEGGAQPTISSVQASGSLGNGACRVSVQGAGYGDRYVLTGPSGYVFSVVFRTAGERTVVFPDVVKPGTYTLTVYSGNCVITRTVAVTGTACP